MPRLLIALILIFGLSACSKADLPDLIPEATQYADGTSGLKGWTPTEARSDASKYLIRPSDPAYTGAVSYFTQVDKRKPKAAAIAAAKQEGFKNAKVVAMKRADKKVVKLFESDKKASVHSVILKGKLNGKPARAALLVWYGTYGHAEGELANSGVHVFMAPTREYEKLGGYAVPSVRWLGATITDLKELRRDGKMSPEKQAKQLNKMYEAWGPYYIESLIAMQMMGMTTQIQMQTLNQMQSWNNAQTICAGDSNCSMTMNSDGTWSADIQ